MKSILFYTALLFCVACNHDDFGDIVVGSKIVVEGWIEEGEPPTVILSRSIPIDVTLDSASFLSYVIRSAKVIVSDGEQEEILHLKTDGDRIPPFTYVGNNMIGTAGKTYTLKVEYLSWTLGASTSIPPSVPIESVWYHKLHEEDTTGFLNIRFIDPKDQKNYYQIATRLKGHDPIFIPALYGNLNDDNFTQDTIEMRITRGLTIFPTTNLQVHYTDGDEVTVRLRTMNREGFDFWNSWQNELINGQNPIFPANSSLRSNIEGGIGIWCGYGHSSITIVAK